MLLDLVMKYMEFMTGRAWVVLDVNNLKCQESESQNTRSTRVKKIPNQFNAFSSHPTQQSSPVPCSSKRGGWEGAEAQDIVSVRTELESLGGSF